jgi:hypothetical protein
MSPSPPDKEKSIMARYGCLAVFLALALAPAARSQSPSWTLTSGSSASTCKIYSLADLGDDPNLGKWIADTIPQMIQPDSWKGPDGKSKLSYFAPGKVMVINQTAAVHAQVDEFLKNLKKSMPNEVTARRDSQVMRAQFTPTDRTAPVTASQAYPVPYPPAAPKHLFHFIIRYEGDGIIDSSVVEFSKALIQAQIAESRNNQPPPSPTPTPVQSGGVNALPGGLIGGNGPTAVFPASNSGPPPLTSPGTTAPMPPADAPPNRPSTQPTPSAPPPPASSAPPPPPTLGGR